MNTDTAPIRLLVVDDHALFRRGLVALLAQDRRFSVVGEAGDANAAQAAARRLQPDVVLLDNHMPGVSGVDAIAGLREVSPNSRILMLTVSEAEDDLAAGLRAGADGYLLKTIDTTDLCDSICRVVEGDAVISPDMMGKMVRLLRGPAASAAGASADPGLAKAAAIPSAGAQASPTETMETADLAPAEASLQPAHALSMREREILRLIARGESNKQIGRDLDIAVTTVKIHVQHILRKLNLGNRVHAAVYATENGLA